MGIDNFIERPMFINNKIISESLDQFKKEFESLIIDQNIEKKRFQIFKLIDGYEVTFHKNKFYQVKKDFKESSITSKSILNFIGFVEKSYKIEGQENYLNEERSIELIFDSNTKVLESAFYTA